MSAAGGGACYFTTEFDITGIYPLTIDGRATEMKVVSGLLLRLTGGLLGPHLPPS